MIDPRNILRRSPHRRSRSSRAPFAIALGCAALIAGMLVLGATAQRGLPGASHYDISAEFADVANLSRYSEVRIAGRRVGQVLGVDHRDGIGRARLQLQPSVGPLREGTTARIRLKGLLGAKFVDLRPADTGAPLQDGATLPVTRTSTTDELFDLFEALDARRRVSLRSTIRGLGAGFLGRGDEMNAALGEFPDALSDLTATASAVNARTGAAERFAPSAAAAAEAFNAARNDIAAGFEPSARALAPFADGRTDLQQTLVEAPPTLDSLRVGLARTDPLLVATERLAHSVTRLTEPAPAALRETTALLSESRRPLESTKALLSLTEQAVPPTLSLTRRADPLVEPVIRALDNGLPLLRELDRWRCGVLGFARNWRSMLAYGFPGNHPVGPMNGIRVTAVANPPGSDQAIADTPDVTPDTTFKYPEPCGLGPVPPQQDGTR